MIKDHPLTLTSKRELDDRIMELLGANPSTKYRVTVQEWSKKRSGRANSQYHVWIPAICEFDCVDIRTTERILKLDFGLPIVLACEQIGYRYGQSLQRKGFFNLPREVQIDEMEFTHVTSLMNTKQHNQMRDNILYFYNTAGLDIGYK